LFYFVVALFVGARLPPPHRDPEGGGSFSQANPEERRCFWPNEPEA